MVGKIGFSTRGSFTPAQIGPTCFDAGFISASQTTDLASASLTGAISLAVTFIGKGGSKRDQPRLRDRLHPYPAALMASFFVGERNQSTPATRRSAGTSPTRWPCSRPSESA